MANLCCTHHARAIAQPGQLIKIFTAEEKFYMLSECLFNLVPAIIKIYQKVRNLRWPNTVCSRFTDSVSDAIKRALGLWYANRAVDKVIPQFHMKWIIKLSSDPK